MSVIGILPASGAASRIGGIPKFCLPISKEKSLIQWHVEQMLEVCDEVKVSTKKEWIPIIKNMNMNISLSVHEPSTMSDAVISMVNKYEDTFIIGMPDTYILNAKSNIYKELLKENDADLVLGIWECTNELKGEVGQVFLDDNNKITKAKDKILDCNYPYVWGTMLFRNNMIKHIDIFKQHPGKQLQDWISDNHNIKGVKIDGKYFDIGTFERLKLLYQEI